MKPKERFGLALLIVLLSIVIAGTLNSCADIGAPDEENFVTRQQTVRNLEESYQRNADLNLRLGIEIMKAAMVEWTIANKRFPSSDDDFKEVYAWIERQFPEEYSRAFQDFDELKGR